MADNERVVYQSGDIAPGQLAPSQANRTNFVPGTSGPGREDEANWPKDHRIPTGTPAFDGEAAGPVEMERTRVVKLHRNTVSDQTVLQPTVLGNCVEAVTTPNISGTHVVEETEQPDNLAERERLAGNDNIKGA
jgi:hypothetical protein